MKILTKLISAGATLAAIGAMSLGVVTTASAAGTLADTTVRNTANLTYLPLPDVTGIVGGLATGQLPDLADALPVSTVSNDVTFKVDRKVDLEVLQTTTQIPVQQNGPGPDVRYEARFTVQNQSNADDIYRFEISHLADSSDFEFNGPLELYADPDNDGFTQGDPLLATYDPTTQTTTYVNANTLSVPIGLDDTNNAIPDLIAPDGLPNTPGANGNTGCAINSTFTDLDCQHQTVDSALLGLVLVTTVDAAVPATVVNEQVTRYQVIATSVDGTDPTTASPTAETTTANDPDNTNGPDIIFADGIDLSTDTVIDTDVVVTNPEERNDGDNTTFIAQAAVFTFSKAQTLICDPINGFAAAGEAPYHIPGAYVRYAITVTNAPDGADALLTVLSDNLQQDMRFDFDLIDDNQSGGENCAPIGEAESGEGANEGVDSGATSEAVANGGVQGNNIKVTLNGDVSFYTAVGATANAVDPDNVGSLTSAGAFLITPGGGANSETPGGTATTAGENILFIAPSPGGPLGDNDRLTENTPTIRLPGQLDAGETIIIEFNAILR